jgi:hypothetical protein
MAGRVPILHTTGYGPAAAHPPRAAAGALALISPLWGRSGVRNFALIAFAAWGVHAAAAEAPATAKTPEVAPVTVTGHRAGCPPKASGPDFACLSAELTASALNAHAQATGAPTAAQALGDGAPGRVGTFDYSGIKEELGANFGVSAFPQRPPPPVYVAPPLSPPPVVR